MARQALDSSHLNEIDYDAQKQTLEVEFTDGSTHVYEGVPEELYHGLVNAPSAGSYFHDNIKFNYQSNPVK